MSFLLDVWLGSEFVSDFGATEILHYFFGLVYKKKKKLLVFYFCWELKFVLIYNVGNLFYFSKNWYFEFHFLASQRLIHPPICNHVTLNIGMVDML